MNGTCVIMNFESLLTSARRGAAFETAVLTELLHLDTYPRYRAELTRIHALTGNVLQQLWEVPTKPSGTVTDIPCSEPVDEYTALMQRLGWNEIMAATMSFATAALYRLVWLRLLATPHTRCSIQNLIDLQKELTEAIADVQQRCRVPDLVQRRGARVQTRGLHVELCHF